MAISKNRIKKAIKTAFDAEKIKTDDQQGSIDRIAAAIGEIVAQEIAEGINTATVTYILTSATGGAVSGTITLKANTDEGG